MNKPMPENDASSTGSIPTGRLVWRIFLVALELLLVILMAQEGILFFYQGF